MAYVRKIDLTLFLNGVKVVLIIEENINANKAELEEKECKFFCCGTGLPDFVFAFRTVIIVRFVYANPKGFI